MTEQAYYEAFRYGIVKAHIVAVAEPFYKRYLTRQEAIIALQRRLKFTIGESIRSLKSYPEWKKSGII